MKSSSAGLDRKHPNPTALGPSGVFVMGMGRSGTSAVTRMLTLLGLSHCIDRDLIAPKHYNPLGFFESRTLQVFNHVLLRRWSAEGWREPRLPANWNREAAVRLLQRPARRLFTSLHPNKPWVYKDSSLNYLLPFWIEALGRKPDVVFIYRHPVAVARSLQRDSDIDFDRALQIWDRQNRWALNQLAGLPVLLIDYEQLVSNPRDVAAVTADWLRSRGYDVPLEAEIAAAESIDARQRHWRADFNGNEPLPDSLQELLSTLEQCLGAHDRFAPPGLPQPPVPPLRPAERLMTLLQRPRWWWWIAELIAPEGIAKIARRIPGPQRRSRPGGDVR